MKSWITKRPALRLLAGEEKEGSEDGILVRTGAMALSASDAGYLPENIFYLSPFDTGVSLVADRCRFVAGSLEDLRFLDQEADRAGIKGICKVGLRLQAPGFARVKDVVMPDELVRYAREIKLLRHLTVRGCFFTADLTDVHGAELGRFFRAGYETAKRMTVTLPCAMPYLCFENAVAAINENAAHHPETLDDCLRALDIMIMQNETAFYAKLYMS
ncbi:MAG: hypothetical protein J6S83_01950 [Lachnospiraceae bacterium]|nr:hypothetical protein [Lachnospiraceae bacterium]